MKNVVALTLMLLLGLLPAAAADLWLTADIPFSFQVRGKVLPAGEYEIYPLYSNAFAIREARTCASAIGVVRLEPDNTYRRPELVFQTRGGVTWLSTITADGRSLILPKSKAERLLVAGRADVETRVILARAE